MHRHSTLAATLQHFAHAVQTARQAQEGHAGAADTGDHTAGSLDKRSEELHIMEELRRRLAEGMWSLSNLYQAVLPADGITAYDT